MKKRQFNNKDILVPRFKKTKNVNGTRYDISEYIDVMSIIPFDKINIPLYTYNCLVYDDDNRPGNTICGYVNGYDVDKDEFLVTIYEKYAKVIDKYVNPIIFTRIKMGGDGSEISSICGFDICPKMYYNFIR